MENPKPPTAWDFSSASAAKKRCKSCFLFLEKCVGFFHTTKKTGKIFVFSFHKRKIWGGGGKNLWVFTFFAVWKRWEGRKEGPQKDKFTLLYTFSTLPPCRAFPWFSAAFKQQQRGKRGKRLKSCGISDRESLFSAYRNRRQRSGRRSGAFSQCRSRRSPWYGHGRKSCPHA